MKTASLPTNLIANLMNRLRKPVCFSIVTILVGALGLFGLTGCCLSNTGTTSKPDLSQPFTGKAAILKSWQGDYPVVQLHLLPKDQREHGVGCIKDAETFEAVWKVFKPGDAVPEIDFRANMVLFVRNMQFYNRISIGQVNITDGVAEVLAMETMSARPIEDRAAMSLAVISRKGITAVQE